MKRLILLLIIVFGYKLSFATHIVGGEVFYTFLSYNEVTATTQYKVTVRLYRDCNVPCGVGNVACLPSQVVVGVYENGNGYRYITEKTLPLSDTTFLSLDDADYPPCISSRPAVCYEIRTYTTTVSLNDNDAGYIIAYENCCRATTVNVRNNNSYSTQQLPGVTFDCTVPGKNLLPNGHNSIAAFTVKKPDLVCYNTKISIDFGATDPDAEDSVSYALAPAFTSGAAFQGANDVEPAEQPPYNSVTYSTGFSGVQPLGSAVTINPATGEVSGISPAAGLYIVNVIAYEWRGGDVIAQHRKDIIIRVNACTIPVAALDPSYITCDGFNLTFSNLSTAANINSYYWDFGDAGSTDNTSADPVATHTYSTAGTYTVTLTTNKGTDCSSTATAEASIYPGFKAGFSVLGSCVQGTFQFTDESTTVYGVVDGWRWDFGDPVSTADTSDLQKPAPYRYSDTGTVTAQLIVSNSKGCIDTLAKEVMIHDKPTVTMPFHDTTICSVDPLQLVAEADINATYTWSPAINILNANTSSPTVHPATTTEYVVTINDGNGCVNSDSVLVNVIDKVTLSLGQDTAICEGDTIQFNPQTNALYFSWSPAESLSSSAIKNPVGTPAGTTTYRLDASVGSCKADDDITIYVSPYPVADADDVSPICLGTTVQLHATYTGTRYTWSPTGSLLNETTLTPTAGPSSTTSYIFTVSDDTEHGCPKPVSDTVTVVVIPPPPVFAGRDTNIVIGQALQLEATGALTYQWTPATGMNNSSIANPVVTLPATIERIIYAVTGSTAEGCSAVDSVAVFQYKTLPEIFVPGAFTPDNDGRNDILKPIVAGMKKLERFSVYNRWGQMLYTTSSIGQGWDGYFNGKQQPAGTYVYEASAIDYLDKHIVRKGTVVLIR